MTREEELKQVKDLIRENIDAGDCGLFSSRNTIGDRMSPLFNGNYFSLDICYGYSYFEVFGLSETEWDDVHKMYVELGGIG